MEKQEKYLANTKSKLPTFDDLINDNELIKKTDEKKLTILLNQHPPANWVAKHPYIKKEIIINGEKKVVPYEYLPINKVEFLLNRIFGRYKIEVLSTYIILNTVCCNVRVHYFHPIYNEWYFHDGVGAQEIQTKKDSGSLNLDMSNINKSAIQMALPIAKSLSIKDACDHFGKLFGSDLNRKDEVNYNGLLSENIIKRVNEVEKNRIINYINDCNDYNTLKNACTIEKLQEYNLVELFINKLEEIKNAVN